MKNIIEFSKTNKASEFLRQAQDGGATILDIKIGMAGGTDETGEAYILKSIIIVYEGLEL
jgi:hypothetical protein